MSTYMGVDLGTQGLKVILLDPERGIVGTAHRPLDVRQGLPAGHSEQDPADWLDALRAACADLRADPSVDLSAVAAIGVSGQQHGLVPLDAEDAVIRPAKLWNDVSSAPQCRAIVDALGGADRLFELTGNHLTPGFTAGKIRWLHENERDHFARLRRVLLPHDYVNLYLTGVASCEPGDASGTGLFDVRGRRFVPEVCAATAPGVEAMLPALIAPGEPAGAVRAAAAEELGVPGGTLVSAGGGDNMMAAIGAGAVAPGVLVMSLGTSGTVFACADRPICDPAGEIAAFCDSTGRFLPLGCTMNATVSTELARRLLGVSLDEMEAAVRGARAGSGGVLCLPFFTGERSPDLPDGSGAFLGLRPDNMTPPNLLRAAMEGATFALCRLLDRLRALGVEPRELRLTGGGSHSPTWQRIVASACGLPVLCGAHPDSAALGAAVHAFWTFRRRGEPGSSAAGCRAELDLDGALREVPADPGWRALYAERRAVYERAVEALTPHFSAIRSP